MNCQRDFSSQIYRSIMKRSIWILLLCILVVSCREKSVNYYKDVLEEFAQRVDLSSPATVIDGLVNPTGMSVSDSLILFREDTDSTTAVLYDTAGNHIVDFLWKGRGPGETMNTLDVSFYDDNTIQASVDPERLFLYKVDALLDGEKMPFKIHSLADGDYASATMIQCDEDLLFYVGKDPGNPVNNTRFCMRDMADGSLGIFGEFPEDDVIIRDFPDNGYSRQTAWQGRPLLKPDHTKVVVPYYYAVGFDIIDIVSREVEYSRFYQYPGVICNYMPQISTTVVKKDEEKYRGFPDVCCTDDAVYFLYSAKKLGDLGNSSGKYVLKFSWTGEPECCYVLDREVAGIAVDKDEEYLYVCVHDMAGGSIDRYEI